MKMNKENWIDIIIIGVMICSVVVGIQYYFNMNNSSCISEPLVFASQQYEEKFGYPFIGSGVFIVPNQTSPIIIRFNSKNTTIEQIAGQQPMLNIPNVTGYGW